MQGSKAHSVANVNHGLEDMEDITEEENEALEGEDSSTSG